MSLHGTQLTPFKSVSLVSSSGIYHCYAPFITFSPFKDVPWPLNKVFSSAAAGGLVAGSVWSVHSRLDEFIITWCSPLELHWIKCTPIEKAACIQQGFDHLRTRVGCLSQPVCLYFNKKGRKQIIFQNTEVCGRRHGVILCLCVSSA